MSQKIKEGIKTDYCPLINSRVITMSDNVCYGCVYTSRNDMSGEIISVRGVVNACTNGDGTVVSQDMTPLTKVEAELALI
jgi:hypothetical protein